MNAVLETNPEIKEEDFFSRSEFKKEKEGGKEKGKVLGEKEKKGLVNDFVEEYAHGLYTETEIGDIKDKLVSFLNNETDAPSDSESLSAYFRKAKNIFATRQEKLEHHHNVMKQELAIRKAELEPGKIDDMAAVRDIFWRNDLDFEKMQDGRPISITGNKKVDKQLAADTKKRRIRPNPSTSLRNNIVDLGEKIKTDLNVNNKVLNKFLETGVEMNKKEVKAETEKLLKRGSFSNNVFGTTYGPKVQNTAEYGVEGITSLFRYLTRGIIESSATKASQTSDYKKINDKTDQILRDKILPQFGKGTLGYLKSEKDRISSLKDSLDPFEYAQYQTMMRDIESQIKKAEEQDAQDIKILEKNLNGLNSEVLDELQKFTDSEDDNFKYKVLLALAVFAPFGPGVLFLGPAFGGYLGMTANMFGPAFAGDLAGGIGGFMTHSYFGPAAEVIELLRINDFVVWILEDWPLIAQLVDIFDVALGNEVMAGLMLTASPLLDSPVTYLLIAGLFASSMATHEIEHRTKKNKAINSEEQANSLAGKPENRITDGFLSKVKKLNMESKGKKGEFAEYRKGVVDQHMDEIAEKKFETSMEAYVHSKMAESFANDEAILKEAKEENGLAEFGDLKTIINEKRNSEDLSRAILEFFYDSDSAIKEKMLQNIAEKTSQIKEDFTKEQAKKAGVYEEGINSQDLKKGVVLKDSKNAARLFNFPMKEAEIDKKGRIFEKPKSSMNPESHKNILGSVPSPNLSPA